jgi:hypothetical protein
MDMHSKVAAFAEKARTLKPHIQSEEATKTALVMPFFQQALGWDVFNPKEFAPEYKANFRNNGNDRVDFAVLVGGFPVMLIEAKFVGEPLEAHVGQLSGYYAPTDAKFAVLTNGLSYRFYCDVNKPNIMDVVPFLDIDLLALDKRAVTELELFTKDRLNIDVAANRAFELMHENTIYARLSREIESPSDAFVRLLSDNACLPMEQLKPIAKAAITRYTSDNAVEVATATAISDDTSDGIRSDEQFSPQQIKVMEAVKAIVVATGSKHRYKVRFDLRKNYCKVSYRNCTLCAFPLSENSEIETIRFMGTALENRRQTSEYPLTGVAAVEDFAPLITKQLEFIDWWYLNQNQKRAGLNEEKSEYIANNA